MTRRLVMPMMDFPRRVPRAAILATVYGTDSTYSACCGVWKDNCSITHFDMGEQRVMAKLKNRQTYFQISLLCFRVDSQAMTACGGQTAFICLVNFVGAVLQEVGMLLRMVHH
jgi:hypothetical protein